MKLKRNLLKASAITDYVFTFIWFVLCASFFALGNYVWIAFLIFAIAGLYDGFATYSFLDKISGSGFEGKTKTQFIICTAVSVVSPASLVLNLLALLRNKDERPVEEAVAETVAPAAGNEKRKKPFYKRVNFIVTFAAFLAIFVSSFFAMCFDTSGFKVKIDDFTLTKEMTEKYNDGKINGTAYTMANDTEYAVTVYKPKSATEEKPAPVVFVLPGFTRTKATMSQFCIELSRRGAVVFCSDPGAQGATTETSTAGANGVEYLVQYIYNANKYGGEYKYCNVDMMGAVGHSAGGGNVTTLAEDFSGKTFEESVIKSVYISGYIKLGSVERYGALRCNAGLSYAYYDEGAFRYQNDLVSIEVAALRFINDVNGYGVNSYKSVNYDEAYGNADTGSYRIIHRENTNHCFEPYDAKSITNTVNFFDETLKINSGIDGAKQIWFGKEFFNGLALAAAFTFIVALCAVLMETPFFKTIKNKYGRDEDGKTAHAENPADSGGYAAASVTASAAPAERREVGKDLPLTPVAVKKKNPPVRKAIFWTSIILSAIIACLDYIPLANLSVKIFPTGNFSNVFTFTFPARMINAILLWAVINGIIGLLLYFGIMLGDNLYQYIVWKKKGVTPEYNWSKTEPLKIRGGGKPLTVLANVGKMLLLCVIMIGSFYFLVQLNYWIFHEDFRFMFISAAPLNARTFVTAIEYIPLILIFYLSNAIRVNGSIAKQGYKEWQVMLISALANSIGLAFILLINYVCYFTTGTPYYAYWGNGTEVWLYVNMVFALVVMMFILPIFNRILYKKTGSVWVGAIVCCFIFIMMTISASVTYIPLY